KTPVVPERARLSRQLTHAVLTSWLLRAASLSVAFTLFGYGLAAQTQIPNSKLPTLFIVGDSTANNNAQGARGWGDPFIAYFDATRINVLNRARAGRSSRTFITEGLWDKVLAERELCDKESGSFVMAWPLRCAASLRLAERLSGMSSVSDQARGQRPLVF